MLGENRLVNTEMGSMCDDSHGCHVEHMQMHFMLHETLILDNCIPSKCSMVPVVSLPSLAQKEKCLKIVCQVDKNTFS